MGRSEYKYLVESRHVVRVVRNYTLCQEVVCYLRNYYVLPESSTYVSGKYIGGDDGFKILTDVRNIFSNKVLIEYVYIHA